MAFPDAWNPAYEGIPADTENINLGANRIRDFKVNVRERANIDHSWGDTLDNGQHNQVSFNLGTADPAVAGTNGYLYTKTVAGNTELFWKDNSGHVVQLTTAGVINLATFPSGTTLSFLQAAPPTGWNVSSVFNDQMIRLVSGAGGGTAGGSWTISGLSIGLTTGNTPADLAVHSHSITDPGHVHGLTDPGHTHTMPFGSAVVYGTGSVATGAYPPNSPSNTGSVATGISMGTAITNISATNNAGAGGGHTHSVNGSPAADGTWRPAYVNACVGVKL